MPDTVVNKIKGITFFDLDGTLLDNSINKIPESTLHALDMLRENAYKIVLSTGRDMDTHYSSTYRDMVKPDAIIHHNGTKITVGNELIFRHVMDPELLHDIYQYCIQTGLCVGTSIGGEDFFINPDKKRMADQTYNKFLNRNFVPFEELFSRNLDVNALSFAGDVHEGKELLESAFPSLELLPFDAMVGADIVEKGFSKAEGLKRICNYYGVDITDTYAFGDSANDAAILKIAGIGIAMGNGSAIAKEAADYITEDIKHDGIYHACEYFRLIG